MEKLNGFHTFPKNHIKKNNNNFPLLLWEKIAINIQTQTVGNWCNSRVVRLTGINAEAAIHFCQGLRLVLKTEAKRAIAGVDNF